MLIEIGLMQRFVLFLGHPVYALTVVLFTLLLGGAAGSALGRRFGGAPRRLMLLVLPVIAATGALYAYFLPDVFATGLGLPRPLRIALSVLLLMPLGVGLGMPLPTGLAALGRRQPEHLAWAWAVNGATSVLGSVLAMLVALLLGFRFVALAGAGCYVLALLLGLRLVAAPATEEEGRALTAPASPAAP
jgi:MFS family permease